MYLFNLGIKEAACEKVALKRVIEVRIPFR